MASVVDDDDEILFIQEIKPNTPKTPSNKQWRQRTLNHIHRPLLINTNSNEKTSTKPTAPFINGFDIKDYDLDDLCLLSPQLIKKENPKAKSSSQCSSENDIIELDSDYEEIKCEHVKIEAVKHENNFKHESIILESNLGGEIKPPNLSDLFPGQAREDLFANMNANRHQNLLKNGKSIPEVAEHDPNQLPTEFDEDAETAVPVETYTPYEPKKCKFSNLNVFMEDNY